MKLLSVRLSDEDAKIAVQLRREGVRISSLVRGALRSEYARRNSRTKDRRPAAQILADIYARHPAPPDAPTRDQKLNDRR
jgi:hypothetical protein